MHTTQSGAEREGSFETLREVLAANGLPPPFVEVTLGVRDRALSGG